MVNGKKVKKFIQRSNLKKGALSKQLDILEKDDIPMTLLRAIVIARIGMKLRNPTKSGKRMIPITRLLIRRALFAIVLKKLAMKRRMMRKKK